MVKAACKVVFFISGFLLSTCSKRKTETKAPCILYCILSVISTSKLKLKLVKAPCDGILYFRLSVINILQYGERNPDLDSMPEHP